jgi:hypothetical protein
MEERLADEMASSKESSDVKKLLRDIFSIQIRHHEENEGYHKEENAPYILSVVILFQQPDRLLRFWCQQKTLQMFLVLPSKTSKEMKAAVS